MSQSQFLLIAEVVPQRLSALNALLSIMGSDLSRNTYIPFKNINTLHFASLIVLDSDPDYAPMLIFEANLDGSTEDFINCLIASARLGLDAIFGCCVDYPTSESSDASIKLFLRSHLNLANAFYRGHRQCTVDSIREESIILRPALETYLDTAYPALSRLSQSEIFIRLRHFIGANASLRWALTKRLEDAKDAADDRRTQLLWDLLIVGGLLLVVGFIFHPLAMLKILGFGIALPIAAYLLVMRLHEMFDQEDKQLQAGSQHLEELLNREDHQVQNHLTILSYVKPGLFRLLTLKVVLAAINFLSRYYFNKGKLGSLTTIHFARWMLINNGKRLLFLSNYDGSWQNYLSEFIDQASNGLTAIWSNVIGFPKTQFLILGGARNEQEFKAFVRNEQVLTLVWYSAYPSLSVENVWDNSTVRNAIANEKATSKQISNALKCL